MARTIEQLKKRYFSELKEKRGMMGGRRGGPRPKGKPKNLGSTIKRMLSYIGNYKYLFIKSLISVPRAAQKLKASAKSTSLIPFSIRE